MEEGSAALGARARFFKYLALPLDRPGHHPLVKRLFKQAEANRDHELMAAFLVAFDRLIRRQRRIATALQLSDPPVVDGRATLLSTRSNLGAAKEDRHAVNPRTGQRIIVPAHRESREMGGCSPTELAAIFADGQIGIFADWVFSIPRSIPRRSRPRWLGIAMLTWRGVKTSSTIGH